MWDVGGVLERTDDLLPRQKLAEQLKIPVSDLSELIFGNKDKYRVQLGKISMEDHQRNVAAKLNLPEAEMEELFTEFFAGDILDIELVDYIRNLKQSYYSAIISNYSILLREKITNIWKIGDAFHHLIISAEVGLMKPGSEIFQFSLNKIGFSPQETVFIDDFIENVEGAKKIGMQGVLFQNKKQTLQDLELLLENN